MRARLLTTTAVLLVGTLAACRAADPDADRPPDALAERVETRVQEVDDLRTRNASTLEPGEPITLETFDAVCRPVGARVRTIAEEEGWIFRQLAPRHRNPANAPDPEAAEVFARFEAEPDLDEVWLRTTLDGEPGFRYLRRIVTQGTCLACHGAREDRPAFVVENYPQDRGYGFAPGDLRGVYSVFIPEALALLPAR